MKSRLRSLVLPFATAFALVLCFLSAASAQAPYTGGNIGGLNKGWWSTGYAINAYGDVTGAASVTTDFRYDFAHFDAFLYTPSGGMIDLGNLGGFYSAGTAINASDEITGYSTVSPEDCCDWNGAPGATIAYHAFLYSGGMMKDLQTLGGDFSVGTGINASGDVVGYSTLSGMGGRHAFLYSGGTMKDLGDLTAVAINDSGQITGCTADGHVFLYSGGTMNDLGISGCGNAINNSGEITGSTGDVFLYSRGTTTDLGWGWGQSINNFSQVAGNYGYVSEGLSDTLRNIEMTPGAVYFYGPFLYTPGTGRADMSSLVPPYCPVPDWCNPTGGIYSAMAINDAGQITGGGWQDSPGTAFAVWFEPVTSPLSAFQATLRIIGKGETHFQLRGSFSLGNDSSGLDPLTQPVLLQLGSLPVAIKKGSFKQRS